MRLSLHASCLVAALFASTAFAQLNAGVSDERVSLPQAPGSVAGVGENATVEGNQGALRYAVEIEVPPGFAGLTPEVELTYSSAGGASVVGMGWSMPAYSIERMTSKGLQRYDVDDRFVVDGSTELVRVAQAGTTATYRARFEGGFVRYTWLERGTGEGGAWRAEYPDGRVAWYGATKAGVANTAAQVVVPGGAKVFAWHLVQMEDAWGHQMSLSWTKDGSGQPLLERIDYLYEAGQPRHSVRFTYEPRADVVSDAKPGFELQLTQRLRDVRVFSGTEQVRRYALEYEAPTISGGPTRLAAVSRHGRSDSQYPVRFSFGYSKTLGGACAAGCDKPFVFDMGTVGGVDFSTGRATLVDINGDALPDVLFSDAQGQHRFFYGRLDAEGRARFATSAVISTKTTGSSPFVLGDPRVQLLDVNGDGFVDLTQAKLPALLCNDGSGDWVDASFCSGAPQGLPSTYTPEDDSGDALQQAPRFVRFFDYDNDRRIDWLRTYPGNAGTEVLANTTSGFTAVTVANIGATFDDSPLQLADVNGDGLQDPVQLTVSGSVVTLQYRLNLGFGQWSTDWQSVVVSGLNASQAASVDLEDINGDGLVDLVAVTGNEVAIALNRNGNAFAAPLTLTSADLGAGAIPVRGPTTTVTYADMNGNGSADIVWFQPTGQVQYLELFPVRPNLISRIDNGIGAVQLIGYGTSIVEQARDTAANRPWPNRVPNASVLVTRLDSFVTLTGSESGGLHEVVAHRYHAGYYDGVEKQFRGYERVETELLADPAGDAQEPTLMTLDFDVGKTDPAFAGRQRSRAVYSVATTTPVLVSETRTQLALCPVAEVPTSLPTPVAFVCARAETVVLTERDPANAVTLEVQREYDGYGNVARETNLGVKNLGSPEAPRGCPACVASGLFGRACGDQCTGDELYTETTWVAPGADTGGLWMLNKPSRVTSGAVPGALNVETLSFYDGPDFVGLPAGKLSRGGLTRVSTRKGSGSADFIEAMRTRLDAHGNPLETIAPNGTVAGQGERRLYTYEPAGLWATTVEVKLSASQSLRQDVTYETAFELISQSSNWYPVVSGAPASPPQQTRYRYDEHGRLVRVLDPGDTDAAPSTEYAYELGSPASRIVAMRRSASSGAADLVSADCLDGRGRVVQTRTQLSQTSWQVSGFTAYDSRGTAVRVYQPYLGTSGACELAPPQGVPFTRFSFDVLRRPATETEPDGALRRYEYAPLLKRSFDEDDTTPSSPSANTPTVELTDGLGRLVSLERTLTAGAPGAVTRLEYDRDGRLYSVTDAAGRAHLQRFDLAGRLTQVTDVNSGVTSFEYDDAGNRTRTTDARGKVRRAQYDTLNRLTAEWDEADEAGTRVSLTYDGVSGCTECTQLGGRLAQVDWTALGGAARDRFGYDTKGNLLYSERVLDGRALVVRHRYDKADRLTSTIYPGGVSVDQTFDGASRVVSMPGYVSGLEYGERNLLKAASYANGTTATWEYDQRLRLTRQRTLASDASAILDLTYRRTPRGDLTEIADGAGRPDRARHGAKFEADAWNRLTRAELDRASGEPEVLSFSYDAIDNILSQASSLGAASVAHVGEYAYDDAHPNAVKQAGATAYAYDAAGGLGSRGSTTYDSDSLGRLTGARRGDVEVGHFEFGRGPDRVVKREGDFTTWYVTDGFEVRDGIAVAYAKLGKQRVARIESEALAALVLSDLAPAQGSAALTPQGDGRIDIADAWLAQAASVGAVSLSGGPAPSPVKSLLASAARRLLVEDVVWLHADHLQSVVAATNASGLLVGEQSFYPSGERRDGASFVDEYGFTGQQRDRSTGLIHFQHRDLDPMAGRWARVDPSYLELSQTAVRDVGEATTAYAYVGNNFANIIDPTGLNGTPPPQGKPAAAAAPRGAWAKGAPVAKPAGPAAARPAAARPAAAAAATPAAQGPVVLKGQVITPKGKPAMTMDVDVGPTLARINAGGKDAHKNDGSVHQNKEGRLPRQAEGYYKEYVHRTEGVAGPGPQRVVVGQGGEKYYTPDHYKTFIPLQ